jgi:hypothetical protein
VYLCQALTIVNHVAKVERVQQLTKARTQFDMWVTPAYVEALLGKMEPGRVRYGWWTSKGLQYGTPRGALCKTVPVWNQGTMPCLYSGTLVSK